jgi:hypothetical protein
MYSSYCDPPEEDDDTSTERQSSYHIDEELETELLKEPTIIMVDTVAKEGKKKLNTPTPFTGRREDLRKFLQEVKIYLLANGDGYPTDLDKVLFVISYMNEGDMNSWKEEFFDTAEQTAAQMLGAKINLGTYNDLIKKIVEDFSPYDAPKDAIYEMKELKMGNSSIEEHVSKFKMLVTKLKLAKNDAVVEYFKESLPIALQKNILSLPEQPKALEEWYTWAVKLQNNYICMRSAISKIQNWGGSTTSNNKTVLYTPPHSPSGLSELSEYSPRTVRTVRRQS